MKPPSTRPEKVAHRLVQVLQACLIQSVRDPNLTGIMISHADVSRDLSFAKVFFMKRDDTIPTNKILNAFERATGFFRTQIAAEIDLRIVPQLRFHLDESLERAARIQQILSREESSTS